MEQLLITKKLESLEKELHSLKTVILNKSKESIISLKGMLKGTKITEKDLADAEKSLFHSS